MSHVTNDECIRHAPGLVRGTLQTLRVGVCDADAKPADPSIHCAQDDHLEVQAARLTLESGAADRDGVAAAALASRRVGILRKQEVGAADFLAEGPQEGNLRGVMRRVEEVPAPQGLRGGSGGGSAGLACEDRRSSCRRQVGVIRQHHLLQDSVRSVKLQQISLPEAIFWHKQRPFWEQGSSSPRHRHVTSCHRRLSDRTGSIGNAVVL
mmetsp:Transcript_12610/g.34837  ORF Transcript_12610/g.34837 Transcript_12610/m.34837 type:complete len:209 (+) Transcript_12610:340-966(+)